MLPEFRSGTIKTLAWPATLEFGAFLAAIIGLIAQSNCISPSIVISGWVCLIFSMTWVILSIDSSFALPRVEKESTAIFGSVSRTFLAV